MNTRMRRRLSAPEGLFDHVSRIEAANLLGYQTEFKIRQLERQGKLRVARGRMGSAWYPRADVLALARRPVADTAAEAGVVPVAGAGARRPTDAELVAYLRRPVPGAPQQPSRTPTVADLVAQMGVSIARAQKVYRFWLAHDAHPLADDARAAHGGRRGGRPWTETSTAVVPPPPVDHLPLPRQARPAERRSPARIERASLIRQLRSPDPAVRRTAFEALKKKPLSADGG